VRADRRRGFCELTTTQAEFRITSEPSGRGQVEPRAIKQPFRQQSSRDRKAEQFEVVAVGISNGSVVSASARSPIALICS
jgi:hypothetical protein